MKHGDTKVPFEKIPALAKALNVDPSHLMRLAIEQYFTKLLDVIKRIFSNIVSEKYSMLITAVIETSHNNDQTLAPSQLDAVTALLKFYTLPSPN